MRELRQAGCKINKVTTKTKQGRFKLSALALAIQLASGVAYAGPEGGEVKGGTGTINRAGTTTTIEQLSDRMAIDWQSYDVTANERVQYIQPSASSISLNRILSNSGSQIHGQIDANGHVILMNPNGVFFGAGATVNVGGLLATGLNIEASDFMNGDFAFSALENAEGTVINSGLINAATGGSVTLLGKKVENNGLIVANLGRVNLAAGNEAVVTFDSEGLMGIRVTREILQDELGMDAAVSNTGEISAQGGQILLTASVSEDIFSQAVNFEGHAKSVLVHSDGSFTLGAGADVINTGSLNTSVQEPEGAAGQIVVIGENVESSGEIRAAGGSVELHAADTALLTGEGTIDTSSPVRGVGGTVKILGNRVGLLDNSAINVSGFSGGGEIYLGGDYKGLNAFLPDAERLYVGSDVNLNADAIAFGDGGKIINWGNEVNRFFGSASAKGGENGGDGGFVEISARSLTFDGVVDVSASLGEAGVVLFDPLNIQIGQSLSGGVINNPDDPFAGGESTTWDVNSLLFEFVSGNLVLEALNNITIVGTENLDLRTAINITDITFIADADYYHQQNNTWDGIIAGMDPVPTVNRGNGTTSGIFTMGSGASLTAPGINVTIYAAGITLGNLNTSASGRENGGSISLTAHSGDISAASLSANGWSSSSYLDNSDSSDGFNGGAISLNAAGTLSVSGDVITSGGNAFYRRGSDQEGRWGGNGGSVSLVSGCSSLSTSCIQVSGIDTSGGNASGDDTDDPGRGGHAGAITLTASSGLIILSAGDDLVANGGFGVGDDVIHTRDGSGEPTLTTATDIDGTLLTRGVGGKGGLITVNAAEMDLNGDITANGGKGGAGDTSHPSLGDNEDEGGSGGDAGQLLLVGDAISVQGAISLVGGDTGDYRADQASGAVSGAGGEVFVVGNTVNIGEDFSVARGELATGVTGSQGNIGQYRVFLGGDSGSAEISFDGTFSFGIAIDEYVDAAFDGTSFESVSYSDASGSQSLLGPTLSASASNNWQIATSNGGTLNTTISFSNIENLTGGSNTDNFVFIGSGSISGTIAGGAGTDTLSARNENNTWVFGHDGVLNEAGDAVLETHYGQLFTDNNGDRALDNGDAVYLSRFESLETLTGGTGDDYFVVGADDAAITISGGDGTGNDTLVADAYSHVFSTDGSSVFVTTTAQNSNWSLGLIADFSTLDTAANGDTDVSFSGVENVIGGSETDVFTVVGDSNFNVAGGNGLDKLVGPARVSGSTQLQNSWQITGANEGTLNSSLVFSSVENLTGSSHDDVFTLAGSDANRGQISGTIDGGGGSDTLNARNQNNVWNLRTTTTGIADYLYGQVIYDVNNDGIDDTQELLPNDVVDISEFISVEILRGGSGEDVFRVETDGFDITVQGGAGDDAIYADTGVANIWTINDTSTGSDVTDSLLATPSDVTQIVFSAVEHLFGNDQTDSFTVEGDSFVGVTQVNGLGGSDQLDVSAETLGNVVIAVGGNYSGANLVIDPIETIIGSDDLSTDQSDTVVAVGTINNSWSILIDDENAGTVLDGVNDGTLTYDEDGTPQTINYIDFANLTGGSGNDAFTFNDTAALQATVGGVIAGGAGSGADVIYAANNENIWLINSSVDGTTVSGGDNKLNGTTFSQIENLYGGTAKDSYTFGFDNSANIYGGTIDADDSTVAADSTVDTINVTGNSGATLGASLNGVLNTEIIAGDNTGSFTVSPESGSNSNAVIWTITDSNEGTVTQIATGGGTLQVQFEGFSAVVGSNNNDQFIVNTGGELTGSNGSVIDGAGGDNTLTLSSAGSVAWILLPNGTVQTGTSVYDGSVTYTNISNEQVNTFTNVQTVSGGSGSHTLTAKNQNNNWRIVGTDSGSVALRIDADTDGSDSVAFTGMDSITGGNSNDWFIFNYDAGNAANNGVIGGTVKGGAGSDSLVAYTGVTNTWSMNANVTSGSVSNNSTTYVSFESIENLSGGGNDALDLSAITFDIAVTLGDLVSTADAGDIEISANGFGSVTGNYDSANPGTSPKATFIVNDGATTIWTVDDVDGGTVNGVDFSDFNHLLAGDDSGDTFNISNTIDGTISGGTGNDTFNTASNLVLNLFGGAESTGGGSGDTLALSDTGPVTWSIGEAAQDTAGSIIFSGIETAQGGSGVDTFNVAAANVTSLEGAGGDDIFNIASGLTLSVFGGTSVADSGTSDLLDLVSSVSATWTLNGGTETVVADSGSIQFSGIETARGGEVQDTFDVTVASVANLEGDAGNDIFNVSSGLALNVFGGTSSADAGTADRLDLVSTTSAIWTLDGGIETVVSDSGNIQFSGIETARGGEVQDTFTVTAATVANLEGDAGNDIFTVNSGLAVTVFGGTSSADAGTSDLLDLVSSETAVWTLDGGTETVVADAGNIQFSGIETARGGEVRDTYNVTAATVSSLEGSDGDDVFNIASGLALNVFGGTASADSGTSDLLDLISSENATWTLNGGTETVVADSGNIQFSGIETTRGGEAQDTFDVTAATVANLEGDTGNDIFNIASGLTVNVFGGTSSADAGTSDSLDLVSSTTAVWTLDGGTEEVVSNAGNIQFSGIETALGGEVADTFNISINTPINLDGETGADIFNIEGGAIASGTLTGGLGDDRFNIDGTLSGTVNSGGDADTVAINAGAVVTGSINGDGSGDTFTIEGEVSGSLDGGAGNDVFNFESGANVSVAVSGGDGDDTFSINSLDVSAAIVGGAQAGTGDKLILNHSANSDWDISNSSQVSWLNGLDTEIVSFSGIEIAVGGSGQDTFAVSQAAVTQLHGSGGSDVFNVNQADLGIAYYGQDASGSADNSSDTLNIGSGYSTATTWEILSTGNAFEISAGGASSVFAGVETINAGTAADIFNIATSVVSEISGGGADDEFNIQNANVAISLAGGGQSTANGDVLDLQYASSAVWTVDGSATQNVAANGGGAILFSGIETAKGSDGQDRFNISASGLNFANGEGSNDTFTLSTAGIAIDIDGAGGSQNILQLTHSTNSTWTIDDTPTLNHGALVSFRNIDVARGGEGQDTFNISSDVVGEIAGYGASDIFNLLTGGYALTLRGGSASEDTATDSLNTSYSNNSTWTIDGGSSESVRLTSGTATTVFSGFEDVAGGDGIDTFNISAATIDLIAGGGGADIFNVNSTLFSGVTLTGGTGSDSINETGGNGSTWLLGATHTLDGGAGAISFSSIENVFGRDSSNGADTFTIDTAFAGNIDGRNGSDIFNVNAPVTGVLSGGDGSDTFQISANISNGADWSVNGGGGDDTFWLNDLNVVARISGGSASESAGDTIWGFNGPSDWTVVANTGTSSVTSSTTGTTGSVAFSFVENLNGRNDVADTFYVSVVGATANIDIEAGGGSSTIDTIDFSGVADNTIIDLASADLGGAERVRDDGGLILSSSSAAIWTLVDFDPSGAVADGVDDGTVVIGSEEIQFVNFSNLRGSSAQDAFVIDDGILTGDIDGQGGGDTLSRTILGTNWNITGSNIGTVDGISGTFSGIAVLQGNAGNDQFNFVDGASWTSSGLAIVGGDGSGIDSIVSSRSSASNWNVTGNSAGNVTGWLDNFSGIEMLNGSTAADTFTVGAYINSIMGGTSATEADYDKIVVSVVDDPLVVWNITSTDGGSIELGETTPETYLVENFSSIENLTGGTTNDWFNFVGSVSVSGLISDLGGTNTLDRSQLTGVSWTNIDGTEYTEQVLVGTTLNIDENSTFTDIESTSADSNGLIGPSQNATWEITTANDGTQQVIVRWGGGSERTYQNVGQIVGRNAINDTFNYTTTGFLRGGINAGSGSGVDTINAPNISATTPWVITSDGSGSVTFNNEVTNFTAIENLNGGSGPDQFVVQGSDSSITDISIAINGGNGANTYTINTLLNNGISGGSGVDIFTINAGIIGDVLGAGGNDQFIVTTSTAGLNLIAGETSDDNDLLRIDYDATANWTLSDSGWQVQDGDGTVNTINFSEFEQLDGSNRADTVLFDDSTFTGVFNGRGGADVYTLAIDDLSFTLHGQDSVSADSDVDTVINTHTTDATWVMAASNSFVETSAGKVDLTGIDAIQGGAGVDTINTSVALYQIEGGENDDQITLGNDVSNGVFGDEGADTFVLGADTISASLNGGTSVGDLDSLRASDSSNTNYWVVSGAGAGSLNNTGAISFSGMETLVGGSGVDEFDINATLTGVVNGAGGNDVFNIAAQVANGILGGADNDQFIVEQPGFALTIDGEGGTGDTLIYSVANANTNQWAITNLNQGTVTNGETVIFLSMENIEGSAATDYFTIAAGVDGTIKGGDGSNTYLFNNSGISTSILGGANQDTIEVTHGDGGSWTNIAGTQEIVDGSATPGTISFDGVESFIAGNGDDNFTIDNATTRVETNGGVDTVITSVAISNGVDLGDGDDTLQITTANLSFAVDGGNHSIGDTFVGANANAQWLVSGTNSATYTNNSTNFITLTNVENLSGGTGNDTYTINAGTVLNGVINGGGHTQQIADPNSPDLVNDIFGDEIIATALTGANVFVQESSYSGSGNFSFANVERLSVTAQTGTGLYDTIQSGNGVNSWIINGNNQGVLINEDTGATTYFTGFQNVQGGTGVDQFALEGNNSNYIDGQIHGGDGPSIDTIDYSLVDDTVMVQIGAATGGIDGVEGVTGYRDGTVGANHQRILIGVDGANDSEISTWTISDFDGASVAADGINDGEFTRGGTTYQFTNFNTLVGHDNNDQFVITGSGRLTGGVIGGGGTNTLNATGLSGGFSAQLSNASGSDLSEINPTDGIVQMSGVSTVSANGNFENTLYAANNTANVWQISSPDSGNLNGIIFNNFGNLTGGNTQDTFTFTTATTLSGMIDGKGGALDSVVANALNDNQIVLVGSTVPEGVVPTLQISNIETLSVDGSGNVLIGDVTANTWAISGDDAGTVTRTGAISADTTLAFSGFGSLRGNAGADDFVIAGADRLSGILSGGDGIDSLDLSGVTSTNPAVVVAVSDSVVAGADFSVSAFESISGSNNTTSRLQAGDSVNSWQISDTDQGVLNGSLAFSNFASLIGGDNVDIFTFMADSGSQGALTGYLDGGAQPVDSTTGDTVNMAALSAVDVQLGGATGMVNIERYIGNNTNSHLRSENIANTWIINGENSGSLNTSVSFENFNYLHGGDGADSFQVGSSGAVTGEIVAGGGEDSLTLTLADNSNGSLRFNGGADTDDIFITGGSGEMVVEFSPETLIAGESELEYRNESANTNYQVLFSSTENIADSVSAARLIVNDSGIGETITLNANNVSVGAFPSLAYDNKNSLDVNASSDDSISIENTVALPEQLILRNAAVLAGSNAFADVGSLVLDSTGPVGASDARLNIDAGNLIIQSAGNAIYLQDSNQLNIAELTSNSVVDIIANNAISDSAGIIMQGADSLIRLQSNTASVVVDNAGSYGGTVEIVADEQAQINSSGRLSFTELTAQNAVLSAGGNIEATGPVAVERTLMVDASGSVVLGNAANQLGSVEITRADNATIVDSDMLAISQANVSGTFTTQSQGLQVNGPIVAESVSVNSGNVATTLSGTITTTGDTSITANGIEVLAAVSGRGIVLNAGTGNLDQQAQINASSGDISITGNNIFQDAELVSASDINITGSSGMQQNSAISANGVVNIVVDSGSITMANNTLTNASSVNYDAANNLVIARLDANSIELAAGGAVDLTGVVASSGDTTVDSQSLTMAANSQMNASGNLTVSTSGNAALRAVSVGDSLSVVAGGNLTVAETLQSNTLALAGNGGVSVDSNLLANGLLSVESGAGDINLRANASSASGSVNFSSGGKLEMTQSAAVVVAGENTLTLASGGNLSVSNLQAETGDIILNSGAELIDLTDAATVIGDSLVINATSGVKGPGTDESFNANVVNLSLSNQENLVAFSNETDLNVTHLGNNGDVLLRVLDGDIILDNREDHTYVGGNDANLAGGVSNANYDIGHLTIFALGGRIIAAGPYSTNQPDVVAYDATLLAGQYGTPTRALVYYVQNQLNIDAELLAGVSYGSGFYQGNRPRVFNDQSNRRPGMFDNYSNGGEQLVEVEELVEIDPAIFTAVNNYFFDDVSIRLPNDQLYEDELEEVEELASVR